MSAQKHRRKAENCPNCNHFLHSEDNFCPKCGQENHDLKVPIGHLVYELVESFTHFDTKLWNTLKAIFTRPGKITKDFLEGKRASYVPPIRLYIFVSFIFFLLVTKFNDNSLDQRIIMKDSKQMLTSKFDLESFYDGSFYVKNGLEEIKKIKLTLPFDSISLRKTLKEIYVYPDNRIDSILIANDTEKTASNRAKLRKAVGLISEKPNLKVASSLDLGVLKISFDSKEEMDAFKNKAANLSETQLDSLMKSMKMKPNWLNKAIFKRLSKLDLNDEDDRKTLSHAIIKSISFTMFVLMPFVAVLLLFIFNRKKYYYEHLIFSIHIHTFYFIVFSIVLGFQLFVSENIGGKLRFVGFIGSVIYLLASLKFVYQKSWGLTILRFFLISIPYLTIASSLLLIATVYGFTNS